MTHEEAITKIKELLMEPTSHARHNLLGAAYDIERYTEDGKPADEVCLRTMYRVMGQLAKVEAILEEFQ